MRKCCSTVMTWEASILVVVVVVLVPNEGSTLLLAVGIMDARQDVMISAGVVGVGGGGKEGGRKSTTTERRKEKMVISTHPAPKRIPLMKPRAPIGAAGCFSWHQPRGKKRRDEDR